MNRRETLHGGFGLAALLGALPGTSLGAAPRATAPTAGGRAGAAPSLTGPLIDLTTPDGNVLAMARMTGDTDTARTKHGWYEGRLVGVRPGEAARDLCGIFGMSSQRLTPLEGKPGWLLLQKECGFFTDLATGRVLEKWTNPYTNETLEPFHIANESVSREIEPVVRDSRFYDTVAGSEPKQRPFVLPWRVAGDRAFVEQSVHVWANNPLDPKQWPRESAGERIQVSDMLSYNLRLGDLQDPALTSFEYWGHWVHHRPWQPWMLMGQAPGHCLYSAFTGSARTPEHVPAHIVATVRERFPSFLVPPTERRKSEPSMIRYMRERKPAPVRAP